MSDQNDNYNNQKYSDLGSQIKDSVMNAVNSGDFSGLSDSISKSVCTVLGDVGDQINRAASQVRSSGYASEERIRNAYTYSREEAKATAARYHREQEERIRRNKEARAQKVRTPNSVAPVQKSKFNEIYRFKGPLYTFGGGTLTVASGALLLGSFIIFSLNEIPLLIVFGALTGGFGYVMGSGIHKSKMLKMARRYRSLCSEKMYCAVDDIARATNTDNKKVVKNIKKLLEKGFFPEGYIDDDNTTFMMSQEVYEQYTATRDNQIMLQQQMLANAGITDETQEILSPEQQSELAIMMSDGRKGINRLHELNDEIPGEVISAKLDTLENLLDEILRRVKEHPDQMNSCHKLMNYYLPTMLKLVEAYAEYDKVSVPGPEMLKAKEEIEKTLDTINNAFVELLNKLFRDSVWDVTADAKVLTTMLKQEGLARDEIIVD